MEQAIERLRYDIDVGQQGINGYYSRYLLGLYNLLPTAALNGGVWWIAVNMPAVWDYRFTPDITLRGAAFVALCFWTVKVWWPVYVTLQYGKRWLELEAIGLQWVRRNDHDFRVTFYRSADRSLQYDLKTREQRLQEELHYLEFRWKRFWSTLWQITAATTLYILIPLLFAYAYEFFAPAVRLFSLRWEIETMVEWACLFLYIVPRATAFGITLYDAHIYSKAYQYIPGAKPLDGIIPEVTLERMRAEQAMGSAAFVSPDDAAQQLGSAS